MHVAGYCIERVRQTLVLAGYLKDYRNISLNFQNISRLMVGIRCSKLEEHVDQEPGGALVDTASEAVLLAQELAQELHPNKGCCCPC